jgi:hypothetical protein
MAAKAPTKYAFPVPNAHAASIPTMYARSRNGTYKKRPIVATVPPRDMASGKIAEYTATPINCCLLSLKRLFMEKANIGVMQLFIESRAF